MTIEKLLFMYIGYSLTLSLLSFIMFGMDKSKAKNNKNRIKEKNLLQITVLGGALGTLIGRILFRHKTNKIYFSIINIASLICEASVLLILLLNL